MRVETLKTLTTAILAVAVAAACSDAEPTGIEPGESGAGEAEAPVTDVATEGERAGVARSTSIVTEFPNGDPVPGASARLTRGKNGVNAWLQTNGLTSGNAYTLWVVVFNHPENCIEPNECRLADVMAADPAVAVDLIGTGGQVIGGDGRATFAGRVKVGELGERGIGLLDAFEPEIHLVVRNHGPKLPGAAQLEEFNGGCEPGPNTCENVQDALHF
ncbi:MAG: hypothetical protein ACODAA_02615 [Gemmatimonadota bacterium]